LNSAVSLLESLRASEQNLIVLKETEKASVVATPTNVLYGINGRGDANTMRVVVKM
jgi:hypothetical protein